MHPAMKLEGETWGSLSSWATHPAMKLEGETWGSLSSWAMHPAMKLEGETWSSLSRWATHPAMKLEGETWSLLSRWAMHPAMKLEGETWSLLSRWAMHPAMKLEGETGYVKTMILWDENYVSTCWMCLTPHSMMPTAAATNQGLLWGKYMWLQDVVHMISWNLLGVHSWQNCYLWSYTRGFPLTCHIPSHWREPCLNGCVGVVYK